MSLDKPLSLSGLSLPTCKLRGLDFPLDDPRLKSQHHVPPPAPPLADLGPEAPHLEVATSPISRLAVRTELSSDGGDMPSVGPAPGAGPSFVLPPSDGKHLGTCLLPSLRRGAASHSPLRDSAPCKGPSE